MSEHSPAKVLEAAKKIIAGRDALSVKLIAAETRPAPADFGETVAAALTLAGGEAGNHPLFIFDDPPPDIGSELPDWLHDGSEVIICAEKPLRLAPDSRVLGRFEYGSSINLLRATSSVDAVVWVSGELEVRHRPIRACAKSFPHSQTWRRTRFCRRRRIREICDLCRLLSAARLAFTKTRHRTLRCASALCAKLDRKRRAVRPVCATAR